MLRAGQLLPPKGLLTLRFDAGRSPRHRQPATGPPGSYPDRTHTGWRTRACRVDYLNSTTSNINTAHAAGHTKPALTA